MKDLIDKRGSSGNFSYMLGFLYVIIMPDHRIFGHNDEFLQEFTTDQSLRQKFKYICKSKRGNHSVCCLNKEKIVISGGEPWNATNSVEMFDVNTNQQK